MKNKHPKLHLAIKKHVNKELQDERVIGIVVSEHKEHANSIALYVILGNKAHLREKNNYLVHNVGVEYHKAPYRQIKHNFKKEKKQKIYETAEIFANCKILYKRSRKIDFLIKTAKLILKKRK